MTLSRGATLARRILGAVSARLDRPEILAVFDAAARQAQHEAIGIGAALAASLRDGGTYVDVGANRGQLLRDALRIAPHGRHVAFEPIPALAVELSERFPAVECRAKALGATVGQAEFCHFRDLDGWSGLRRNPEISDARGRPEFIDVEVSTLDEELRDLRPSVVKIDVEGAELDVLRGGREVLLRARPLLIVEHVRAPAEIYGASSADLWSLMDELGYVVFAATGDGPVLVADLRAYGGVVNWLARPA